MNDKIVVLTCKPAAPGVKAAYSNLSSQCIINRMAQPILLELSCEEPYDSIKSIEEIVSSEEYDEIILEVGAGMRIITHYAVIALTILKKPYTIHYIPEPGTFKEVTIPAKYIEVVQTKLTPIEKQVLQTIIENPGTTIQEIAKQLNRKEKTIANIITRLKNKQLVKTQKRKTYPTPSAKTLIN